MLRGYRCILVAFAGLALTAAQQQSEQRESQRNAQQTQGTASSAPSPTKSAEPPYRPYPERYSDACYDAQDHDAADLCAQWRAALAAEKAAQEARIATIAAIIGTFLSLATVIGLIVTIWQTHGALGEARRGNRLNLLFERRSRREARKAEVDQARVLELTDTVAKANKQSAEVSQQALIIGQRARVLASGVNMAHGPDSKTGEMALVYEVAWKNHGLTEAHNAVLETSHVLVPPGAEPSFPPSKPTPLPAAVIPPNSTRFSSHQGVVVSDLEKVWSGELELFLYSRIEYNDIFAEQFSTPRHYSTFVGKAQLPGPPSLIGTEASYIVRFRSDIPGNEAT